MHARKRLQNIPSVVATRLSIEEKKALENGARQSGLTLSEFVRCRLIAGLHIRPTDRLLLAEVCALRKQTEDLLQLISDLTDADVAHSRQEADRLRPALVGERLLELQQEATQRG